MRIELIIDTRAPEGATEKEEERFYQDIWESVNKQTRNPVEPDGCVNVCWLIWPTEEEKKRVEMMLNQREVEWQWGETER